eukprot:gene14808-31454_t
MRGKLGAMLVWKEICVRRKRARWLCVGLGLRWKLENMIAAIYHWRSYAMQCSCTLLLQRVMRGFLGRSRVRFLKELQTRVIRMQAGARQIVTRTQYKKNLLRRIWAAVIIQKSIRGLLTRRRVQGIVIAMSDLGLWQLQKEREVWELSRMMRAASAVQMAYRRYLRKKRAYEKKVLQDTRDAVARAMKAEEDDGALKKKIYRRQLEEWYIERKVEHDKQVYLEEHTAEQKRLIMRHRQKQAVVTVEGRSKQREEQLARAEADRVRKWLQDWVDIEEARAVTKRAECWQSINTPETPDEKALRKDLKARAKKHVKDVLRRADKQRIPMELPEAQQIALKEVVEMEVKAERDRVKEEMKIAAEIYKSEQDKREQAAAKLEELHIERLENLAAQKLHGQFKIFLAKKILRQKAYARYKKHFDVSSGCYYYEERRSGRTSWIKPKAMGAYDIACDASWVVMRDS